MMKSAAVSASDSASIDGSSTAEDDSTRDGDKEQNARQLEGKQIILEEGRGDRSYRVQLLQLLLVVVTGDNQLRRQLRPNDDHDLADQTQSDESRCELPTQPARVSQLGRVT